MLSTCIKAHLLNSIHIYNIILYIKMVQICELFWSVFWVFCNSKKYLTIYYITVFCNRP